jgi:integrase
MSSIKKRTDGIWRARYRDPSGKEHARHFGRKVDAQRWLDEVTTSVVTGQYVDPNAGRLTFLFFYVDWSARQCWVSGTKKAMDLAAGSVEFGNVPLRALRPSHLETWVKGMTSRGLAATTVHTRFQNVHSVLRAAMRDRLIAVDPAENIALPRLRRVDAAMTLPSVDQVAALLDAAQPDFKAMLALAAFAGLRVGEVRGLQLGDINFLGRTIEVRRQAQHKLGGGREIRGPKYASERAVYAPDGLLTELSAHVAAQEITASDDWLFSDQSDLPVHESTVGRRWRAARKAAKVPDLKFHDLRHFYASGLIAEGCDVVTVQKALGHSSPSITLDTYSHLWPTAEDRTRRAAGVLFTAVAARGADSLRTQAKG